MKKLLSTLFLVIITVAVYATNDTYETGKNAIICLYQKHYDKITEDLDEKVLLSEDEEQAQLKLKKMNELLINNFPEKLSIEYLKTIENKGLFGNDNMSTIAYLIKDDKNYAYVSIIFNNENGKILRLDISSEIKPIPTKTKKWIAGIIPILVALFNITVIVLLIASKMPVIKKILFSVITFLINTPAIIITSGGVSFKLLKLQMLLGIEYHKFGYEVLWGFGIPIGAIISLIVLLDFKRSQKFEPDAKG